MTIKSRTVPKRAYFVGIKGVGMTAAAVYLKESGWDVLGSDVLDKFPTDTILQNYKIPVLEGFTKDNIKGFFDVVVVTGAHGGMTNIEAQTASEKGLKTMMHGQFLGELAKNKIGISVAGSHGKTTTAALVASLLTHTGLNPSYAVGTAAINDLGAAGHYGGGKFFVSEADEYVTCPATDKTARFLWQNPSVIVLTNIEYDHPDVYESVEHVFDAFMQFIKKLPPNGTLVACIDDANASKLISEVSVPTITYGFSPRADYHITHRYTGDGVSFFTVGHNTVEIGEFMLKIAGKHNVLNALGAALAVHVVGVSFEQIKKNIMKFTGTKRRFECISQIGNNILYDDYAHHPSEIKATLRAFREWFPKRRIVLIFQPHTFSRTKSLLPQFADSFSDADMVMIPDIYPSAREPHDTHISSKILVAKACAHHKNILYTKNKEELVGHLSHALLSSDVVVTMGAGDIYLWHKDILKVLKEVNKTWM